MLQKHKECSTQKKGARKAPAVVDLAVPARLEQGKPCTVVVLSASLEHTRSVSIQCPASLGHTRHGLNCSRLTLARGIPPDLRAGRPGTSGQLLSSVVSGAVGWGWQVGGSLAREVESRPEYIARVHPREKVERTKRRRDPEESFFPGARFDRTGDQRQKQDQI